MKKNLIIIALVSALALGGYLFRGWGLSWADFKSSSVSNSSKPAASSRLVEVSRSGASPALSSASTSSISPRAVHTATPGGFTALARIQQGGRFYELHPNEIGLYPRQKMEPKEKVKISVSYPEGEPGDSVVIQAEDGGFVDGSIPVKPTKLDDRKSVGFEFQTNVEEGIYRVTLRKGVDEKRLEFWVGEEPKLQIKN